MKREVWSRGKQADDRLVASQPLNFDDFLAGCRSLGERDGIFGKAELLGQKETEFLVGFSLQSRSVDFDLESLTQPANDFTFGGVGNRLDLDFAAFHARDSLGQTGKEFAMEAVKGSIAENHKHIARLKLRAQFFHDFIR